MNIENLVNEIQDIANKLIIFHKTIKLVSLDSTQEAIQYEFDQLSRDLRDKSDALCKEID